MDAPDSDAAQIFWTASLAFVRDGQLLVVRKQGTRRFMLPGGKLEPGETPLQCALREAYEEVGAHVPAEAVEQLGHWQAAAANEPGALVDSVVHVTGVLIEPEPLAEIAEARWLDLAPGQRDLASDQLAPLLLDHVLPALRARIGVSDRVGP